MHNKEIASQRGAASCQRARRRLPVAHVPSRAALSTCPEIEPSDGVVPLGPCARNTFTCCQRKRTCEDSIFSVLACCLPIVSYLLWSAHVERIFRLDKGQLP